MFILLKKVWIQLFFPLRYGWIVGQTWPFILLLQLVLEKEDRIQTNYGPEEEWAWRGYCCPRIHSMGSANSTKPDYWDQREREREREREWERERERDYHLFFFVFYILQKLAFLDHYKIILFLILLTNNFDETFIENYRICCFEQNLEAAPYKTAVYDFLHPISKTIQGRRAKHAGHCWKIKTNSLLTFSDGLLQIDTNMLADQHKLTFVSSVQTVGSI